MISKSQYVKGLQCPKALWFYKNRKDLAPEITADKQALFDTGHEVGQVAMQYFGDGVEVTAPYWDISGAIETTNTYAQEGHDLIFEATACHPTDGSYARIDILKRVGMTNEWDMIEVKSSTSIKDYHIDDMALQYHVFHGAGYKIRNCYMMIIDNNYVRDGEIDPKKLLKLEDISSLIFAKQNEVEDVTGQLTYLLQRSDEPSIHIGERCFKPFDCDYKNHCWKHVPEYSVYNIFNKDKAETIAQKHGVEIEKLPTSAYPNGKKVKDIESYLNGETIVDQAAIKGFLNRIEYPIYYLDYETINPTIPLFDGTRPFQQVPFQFSVHIQHEPNSDLEHYEFLHKEQSDPQRPFVEKLIELCGQSGTILVYNQAFEKTRNKELANEFPEYASMLHAINERMIDLMGPFKNRWLYHPNQNSSASIKAVLPCFTDLSYKDLEIGNGADAMLQYSQFMSGKLDKEEHETLWQNLSAYCKQDTYAMVLLLDVLRKYNNR